MACPEEREDGHACCDSAVPRQPGDRGGGLWRQLDQDSHRTGRDRDPDLDCARDGRIHVDTAPRRRLRAVFLTLVLAAALAAIEPALAGAAPTPMYLYNLGHTGYESNEKTINAGNVGTLAPKWIAQANDTISAQAIPANGLLYWGSWDGLEHATNPETGEDVWTTSLGEETKEDCNPPHLGVASSAAIRTVRIKGRNVSVLYVGGGDGRYYALNALTGEVLWSHFFGSPADGYFMWSSPSVYQHSVYVGIASIGDCPLIPGEIIKMNASTGTTEAKFDTTPPGCPGGGPWTSPTIDIATGTLYVNTGTDGGGFCGQEEPLAQTMLELNLNLELKGAWKPPPNEQVDRKSVV